jgi:hypothetical protein
VSVSDWSALRPTELSFHMMRITEAWTPGNPFAEATNTALFNKHVGSTVWWNEISQKGHNARVDYFVEGWARNAHLFQQKAKRFWIY